MDDSSIIHAFKHMHVPLMIIGPDGAILHCNSASHRLFGYEGNELVERPVFEVLSIASVDELHAQIEPSAIDAIIKDVMGRSKAGNPIPLVVQVTAWNDANRGLQHALALRDVTDEIEAARFAKAELARVNNAVKGARIGVFEYNPVANTVIVSDIWRDLLELEPSDEVDVQMEWRGRVHPDDLETALKPVQMCIGKICERATAEHRCRAKDGSHWRWMHVNLSVSQRDKAGRVTRVIGAMTDITESKVTEEKLRISAEQFRSTFNSKTIGKAIIGLDGNLKLVNSALCDLLGYSEGELLKTTFQVLTHPDDLDAVLLKIDSLMDGSISSYQLEKRLIRANGAIVWGLASIDIVRDAEGHPDHFILQVSDLTEQRRVSDLRNKFVSTVSHELRTPLTSVLGSLTLLSSMEDEPFSDAAQRLLFIAQENGKRLHALVNDILDFEKFSAQQMQFKLSRHKIIRLIDEAVLANLVSADRYEVRFQIHCSDRSLTGFVDPKRFQQVMTNLLTNAAKFADKGSTIDVTVEKQSEVIRVEVTNEGVGISQAFRNQVFKPFAQEVTSSTGAKGGTGLGLNITKQIVEQTGGTIGFDSDQGGKTTFWFTVPINEPG